MPTLPRRFHAVSAFAGLLLWLAVLLPTLRQSFWLDETAVSWLTGGGFSQLFERWQRWPYQSLLHGAIGIEVASVLGGRELVLRATSALAILASLLVFVRVAKRVLPPRGATLALLVLLGSAGLLRAASFYRPYAFGLLALLLSWIFLFRWSERARAIDAVGWSLSSALALYFHLTLAAALLAELPLLVHAFRAWPRAERTRRLLWLLLPAALAVPLVGAYLTTWKLGALLNWTVPPTFASLLSNLTPEVPLGVLAVAALASGLVAGRFRRTAPALSPTFWWVATPWWLLPILIPFLLSSLLPIDVFAEQYLVGALPGLALVAGGLFSLFTVAELAIPSAIVLLIAIPFTARGPEWPHPSSDPWREALGSIRAPLVDSSDLVLLATDFPESRTARFDAELEPGGMLLSPLAAYPIGERALGVSSLLTPASENRLALLWAREGLASRSRFFLLQRQRDEPLLWLEREHAEFRPRVVGLWESLELVEFDRRARLPRAPSSLRPLAPARAAAHFERDQ